MTHDQPPPRSLAIVGTGNFSINLQALTASFGLETAFFVDELRTGDFLGRPVRRAEQLGEQELAAVAKWLIAISHPEHSRAARARLLARGVPAERILPLADDPALQALRLLFEELGAAAVDGLCAPGVVELGQLEERFFGERWAAVLGSLDPGRRTVALGYYGRGGGFRSHIGPLVPLLEERFNVLTLSDEVAGHAEEARRHLYMSAARACTLEGLDLALSAHVFPCSPPEVPRVSFSHVIYDFNLTAEYHAARIAQSDTHYLFASSRPCFDWYVDLARRFGLKNRLCVIPGGYLQLDRNLAALRGDAEPSRILYAPTLSLADYPHRDLVTSADQGPELLRALLAAFPEREIIFRPHPSDLRLYELGRADPRLLPFARMLALCRSEPRCHLDDDATSYLESYGQAALLISDTSSTAFTFAFTTGRPVVFFSPRERDLVEALGATLRFVGDREQVGQVVRSLDELTATVERLLLYPEQEGRTIQQFRDRTIFNVGSSAQYFLDNVEYLLSGERHPDWHYLNW